jgi:hypothetical protein
MITQDKIFVFQKYSGSPEKWASSADVFEKNVIDEEDWPQIKDLLGGLSLVKSGTASPLQINELQEKMQKHVDYDPTRKLLFDLA